MRIDRRAAARRPLGSRSFRITLVRCNDGLHQLLASSGFKKIVRFARHREKVAHSVDFNCDPEVAHELRADLL